MIGVQAYAGYLNTAADGLFAELFGGECRRRIIAQVAMVPGHELSLENVVIAEVDGRIVGSCAGGQDTSIPVGLLARALGWQAPRAALVWMAGFPTTAVEGAGAIGGTGACNRSQWTQQAAAAGSGRRCSPRRSDGPPRLVPPGWCSMCAWATTVPNGSMNAWVCS